MPTAMWVSGGSEWQSRVILLRVKGEDSGQSPCSQEKEETTIKPSWAWDKDEGEGTGLEAGLLGIHLPG